MYKSAWSNIEFSLDQTNDYSTNILLEIFYYSENFYKYQNPTVKNIGEMIEWYISWDYCILRISYWRNIWFQVDFKNKMTDV